jgi:hypothetical protein
MSSALAQGEIVRLLICDYAGTPQKQLEEAREVVRGIYRRAGIEVEVEFCSTGGCRPVGTELAYFARLRSTAHGRAFGRAMVAPGQGGYIDVYPKLLSEKARILAPGQYLLGHTLAHELGHMLLGTTRHAPAGLMKARWETEDSWLMAKGMLEITPGEAAKMRERIAAMSLVELAEAR